MVINPSNGGGSGGSEMKRVLTYRATAANAAFVVPYTGDVSKIYAVFFMYVNPPESQDGFCKLGANVWVLYGGGSAEILTGIAAISVESVEGGTKIAMYDTAAGVVMDSGEYEVCLIVSDN